MWLLVGTSHPLCTHTELSPCKVASDDAGSPCPQKCVPAHLTLPYGCCGMPGGQSLVSGGVPPRSDPNTLIHPERKNGPHLESQSLQTSWWRRGHSAAGGPHQRLVNVQEGHARTDTQGREGQRTPRQRRVMVCKPRTPRLALQEACLCLPREGAGGPGNAPTSDFQPQSPRCPILSPGLGWLLQAALETPFVSGLPCVCGCRNSPTSPWEGTDAQPVHPNPEDCRTCAH